MTTPTETPVPKRFLTEYEQRTFEQDARQLRGVVESRNGFMSDEGRASAAQALRRTEQQIAAQQCPEVGPEERDRIHKRVQALEERLKDGLLSPEEMRRNPNGAVVHNVAYEKRNKHLITRWRNGLRALNKGRAPHEVEALCNLDRLRPRTSTMSMLDCQIPQVRTFSEPSAAFKANYDTIDWGTDERLGETPAPPRVDTRAELMAQFSADEAPAAAKPAPAAPTAKPTAPPQKPHPGQQPHRK